MVNSRTNLLDSIKIAGVHATYWSAFTILGTFVISFLSSNGYSSSKIGLIVSSAAIVSALTQPIWGYIADSKFDLKNITLFCMVASLPFAFIIPKVVGNLYLLLIMNSLFSNFEKPVAGLLDAITNIGAENNPKIIYAISRGTGSLFSAITMIVIGSYLEKTGVENLYKVFAVLMTISIILLASFGDYNTKRNKDINKLSFLETISELLNNKPFFMLLASNMLLNIGLKASLTYAPIMIKDFGGTVANTGTSMAINTAGMFPMMLLFSYLIKRKVDNNKLYIAASVFTILRILSMAMVTSVSSLLLVQVLNSLSYGFLQPSMINALSQVVPIRQRASAITIMASSIMICSSFFGDFIGGILMDTINASGMFIIFTFVAVVGMLMYIPFMKLSKMK